MDPVTAFGLAASIIQVAQVSASLVSKCYQRYRGSDSDDGLHEVAASFQTSMSSLQTMITPLDPNSCSKKHEVHLLFLAKEGLKVASELQAYLKQFDVDENVSKTRRWKQTIFRTAKREWKDADIKKKQSELEACRREVGTAILVDLREQFGELDIENQKGFADLERSVQSLVKELASHKTEILSKIESENQLTRTLVATEFQQLRLDDSVASRRNKLLKKLVFPQMEIRENQVKDAHQHTFQWIFGSGNEGQQQPQLIHNWNDFPEWQPQLIHNWSDFSQWLKSGSSTYWISGKPGAGKSTLMRFLRLHPQTDVSLGAWSADKTLVTIHCFVYSGIGSVPLQYTVEGLLRSILYQLVEKLDHTAVDVCLQVTKEDLEWQERTLKLALMEILNHYTNTTKFCFFIDGLDEICKGVQNDIREYLRFQDSLLLNRDVKFCVSSRPWQIFQEQYAESCSLRLQDLTGQDIQNFVHDTLNVDKIAVKRPDLDQRHMARITQDLTYKAEGVFLWAVVAATSITDGIQNGDSISELQQRVDELPDALEDLYEHMFSKIDKSYRATASLYLLLNLHSDFSGSSYIVYAFLDNDLFVSDRPIQNPPLTMSQILELCRNTEKRLLTRSGGILETVGTYKSFRDKYVYPHIEPEGFQYYKTHGPGFIHSTVVEFLRNRISILERFARDILPKNASLRLAYTRAELSVIWHLPWTVIGVSDVDKFSILSRLPVNELQDVAWNISEAMETLQTDLPYLRCELERVSRHLLAQLLETEKLGLDERHDLEYRGWVEVVFIRRPYAADYLGHHVDIRGGLPFTDPGLSASRATYYVHCALSALTHQWFENYYKPNAREVNIICRVLRFMVTMVTIYKADVNYFIQGFAQSPWGETAWQRLVTIVPHIKGWTSEDPEIFLELRRAVDAALSAGADPNIGCILGDTVQPVAKNWFIRHRFELATWFDLEPIQMHLSTKTFSHLYAGIIFRLSPLATARLWNTQVDPKQYHFESTEPLYELMSHHGCAMKIDFLHLIVHYRSDWAFVQTLKCIYTTPDVQGQDKDNWIIAPALIDHLTLPLVSSLQDKICSIMQKWLSDSMYPLNIKDPIRKDATNPYSGELLEIVMDLIVGYLSEESRRNALEEQIHLGIDDWPLTNDGAIQTGPDNPVI